MDYGIHGCLMDWIDEYIDDVQDMNELDGMD